MTNKDRGGQSRPNGKIRLLGSGSSEFICLAHTFTHTRVRERERERERERVQLTFTLAANWTFLGFPGFFPLLSHTLFLLVDWVAMEQKNAHPK